MTPEEDGDYQVAYYHYIDGEWVYQGKKDVDENED